MTGAETMAGAGDEGGDDGPDDRADGEALLDAALREIATTDADAVPGDTDDRREC